MIPRIHKRGTSFKTAIAYILHDPEAQSANRVEWTCSVNCGDAEPAQAWRPMYDTWDRRTALKRQAGIDLRGADNKSPVYHLTLSWSPDDRVTKDQMLDAALKALAAIGLQDHQAVIASHTDKDHQHLHIIANTVHPVTGKTAALKFPALALRDFAKEHDRIRHEFAHNQTRGPTTPGHHIADPGKEIRRSHRRRSTQHAAIVNRMKRHRAEHDHAHMVERDVLWARHRAERSDLYANSKQAAGVAREYIVARFKPHWRELYKAQKQEFAHLGRIQHSPLERAIYVFMNEQRLAGGGRLSAKQKFQLIQSPAKLFKTVERIHTGERRALALIEKAEMKERMERVWSVHEYRFSQLKARQDTERAALRTQQRERAGQNISFGRAQAELAAESQGAPIRMATNAPPGETDQTYVERIRQALRTRYNRPRPGKDFDHEM